MATSGRGQATNLGVLQHILGADTFDTPLAVYCVLLSAVGTSDQGPFTELTGGGYLRAEVSDTNAPAAWSPTTQDATGTWKTNAAQIAFPTATAGWSPAVGYGLADDDTAALPASLLYWGTFDSATTVGAGATASFAAGALRVTEA